VNEEVNINLLLDRLYTTGKIDKRYMWALKDYITNIEQENKKLKETVEILEEEKKIPEKIKDKYCSQISKVELAQKYNEIIDYLKSKGE